MNRKKRIEFLLQCLELKRDAILPTNPISLGKKDWKLILKDAEFHRIKPLLYYHLKKGSKISVPDEVKAKLEESYLQNSLANTQLFYDLSNILELAEKMNIPLIALKGSYIACLLYPSIALRPMRDIDLLAKTEDIVRFHDALLELGWKGELSDQDLQTFEVVDYSKHPLRLGLHSQISEIPATDPWAYTFSTKIGKSNALVFRYDLLLPYLCIHICKHLSDLRVELIRIYDIAQMLKLYMDSIDWDEVIDIAKANQAKADVYRILDFFGSELGEDIPDNVLAKLKENGPSLTIKEALYRSRDAIKIKPIVHITQAIQTHWFDPHSITIGQIIKLIFGSIFPGKKYMIEKYKPKYLWLFFIYYPVRITLGIGNSIKSLFHGLKKG